MDTLRFLISTASATIFTFTAGLAVRFLEFPFRPYRSVVKTSRLLRTHHLTTVALVAFSFLIFALLPAGTGFSGGEALRKIWETERRQVEVLYLVLFVLGSTVLTIFGKEIFSNLLVVTKPNRQIFTDIYNVFVAFTILWFVLLAALTRYIFDLSGASIWLEKWEIPIDVSKVLTKLKFSDVSDLVVSPALWIILGLSGYFGYLLLMRWSLRRGIRNIVRGKDAQKALSRTVIMLSTSAVAFILIIVPALYLALLSASLLKHTPPVRSDFEYLAACYVTGNKLNVTMKVKNHKNSSAAATQPLFIDWDKADKALKIDPGDFFWMSRKGFYFDPSETRYYRLELPAPAQFPVGGSCTAHGETPKKGFLSAKAAGDSYSVSATQ